MPTIVIHAPWYKKDENNKSIGKLGESHSWETYFQTGIGLGYMLYPDEVALLQSGPSTVVLLRNREHPKRAEGQLLRLQPTGRGAGSGGARYDVHFVKVKAVTYSYSAREKLKENGVKVF